MSDRIKLNCIDITDYESYAVIRFQPLKIDQTINAFGEIQIAVDISEKDNFSVNPFINYGLDLQPIL